MTTTPSKTDLEYEILYNPKFVPFSSSMVKVKTSIVKGKPSYLMKNNARLAWPWYFDLDELSNQIWNLIDGKRSVTQIVEEIRRQKPRVQERTILGTLLFFAENNLLLSSVERAPKKRFRVVSAFEIDIDIIKRSNDFLQSLNKKMRPFFNRYLLLAIIAFIIVISILFAPEVASIYGKRENFEILGSTVVGFFFYTFITLLPIIAIHETAHGLTLAHYGGEPGAIGTGLFHFGPFFYVETGDAWELSRYQRIMVYLAGNISTLLIGSVLVIVHLMVTIPEPGSLILTMTAFYCFTMALFNFAPPFETDGYYVLTDIVNMPNLRHDSYSYLGSVLKRAFGMDAKAEIPKPTERAKRIFLGYAVMSVVWIFYSMYQTTIFTVYMTQDVTSALSNILNTVQSSQALPASMVVIAALSTAYFGTQILGYGLLFRSAVRKASAKPLQVEAIHDRNLAVFAYLPSQAPESLSSSLRSRMEKTARKLTSKYEMKQIGRSWITVLRMGETRLAHIEIKENLGRIESKFSSAYQNLIKGNKETLQKSIGIYAPEKARFTNMFSQIAAASVEAGNPGAGSIGKAYLEKQNETIIYLLCSAFGTIWTLEVEPAEEYDIEKELCSSLFLEDLALTDLYSDVENFKKRIIYGYDTLAKLATDADTGLKECLGKPEKYQLISVFEPIRNRITLLGRTGLIEKNIDTLSSLLVAQAWSGYLDDLLSMTCFALSTVNRSSLPNVKEIKEMSTGELAVLSKEFLRFTENQKLVDKCIRESEAHLVMDKQSLRKLKDSLRLSKTFEIGRLDAMFQVNVENMENLPARIREFRKQWKLICERIEKVRGNVEKEFAERKPAIERRKRKMLRTYPLVIALSIALLVLSFQPAMATWSVIYLSVALVSHGLYWFLLYRVWRSFRKATRYPSHVFNTAQIFILALTEAIYEYVVTGNILTDPD